MRCPSCGAAARCDAAHCAFCRTRLKTVACSRCREIMFSGSKYCPHCSGATAPVEEGAAQGRACPRCTRGLVGMRVASDNIEQCPGCAGLWMSVATFDHICSDSQAQSAATTMAVPPGRGVVAEVVYIKCPECSELMARKRYSQASGVLINTCRAHGVWLDGGELRQIVEFIRAGGLDRARRVEQERLEAERRALDARRRLERMEDRFRAKPGWDEV